MERTASFGYWVRRRRKALDLTQAALADRIHCSVETVKKIERDERRPSCQLAELLAQQLAVPAEELEAFVACARGQRPIDQFALAGEPLQTTQREGASCTTSATFLFTDIAGSTELWDQIPEAMAPALARHDALLRQVIQDNDGRVFKSISDGHCAVHRTASGALSAAIAGQRALLAEPWGKTGLLNVRMAIHSCVVQERDGDYFGPGLNRVSRLLEAAHGGQILLSQGTVEMVSDLLPPEVAYLDLGEHRLKGLARPERIFQVLAPGLPADFPSIHSLDYRSSNLPTPTTTFVGRKREIADVTQLLATSRLLTLTGPGGVGKTRLALEVAANQADRFWDGVFLVSLAAVTDPTLLAQTIIDTLRLKVTEQQTAADLLKQHLQHRHILLILDNFEQIVDGAQLLGELLSAAPRLSVLVTSREILHLYGEQEYPVSPLAIPDRTKPTAELSEYESVALFVRHAQLSNPNFRLTEKNAQDVAEICIRLDGLPLAIELAAARSKAIPPNYLLSLLDNSLDALSGGPRDLEARHQTLQAAIGWSYDLLDMAEKQLFSRLAVFQGGRSLDALQEVCQPGLGMSTLIGVESLLNKSLLHRGDGPDGVPRFFFLDTIHQFARERLAESGEVEAIQRRHAVFFAELAEQAEPELRGPDQENWSARLRAEYDNLRAALSWAIGGGDPELGLRLAGALSEFWYYEGPISEGEKWIRLALARLESEQISPGIQAKVLNGAGMLAFATGDHARGKRWNQQALNIAREAGEMVSWAWALFWLSAHATTQPETYGDGITLIEKAQNLFRETDDQAGLAWSYNQLGELNRLVGDLERARVAYESSLAICRETGNRRREAIALLNLGYVAQRQGDYQQAERCCLAGLALLHKLKLEYHSAIALSMLAGPLASQGRVVQAATILGASEGIFERMAATLQPADRVEIDNYIAQVRQMMEAEAFDTAWQTGREMSFEQALAYAFAAGEEM